MPDDPKEPVTEPEEAPEEEELERIGGNDTEPEPFDPDAPTEQFIPILNPKELPGE